MRLVYLNCVLSIAVDRASSAEDGAFTSRNTDLLQPHYVEWKYSGSEDNLWTLYDNSDTIADLEHLPLLNRGPVIQERLFSPRILHFASDRIHWECAAIESLPTFINEYTHLSHGAIIGGFTSATGPTFALPQKPLSLSAGNPLTDDERDSTDNDWDAAVSSYSRARLTFPAAGKLVAFSGIGHHFAQLFPGPYLAGIFAAQLPWALLWQGSGSGKLGGAVDGYAAPSWSWAAYHGLAVFYGRGFLAGGADLESVELLAEVCGTGVELVDPGNGFGQVGAGEIALQGVLLPCVSGLAGVGREAIDLGHRCSICTARTAVYELDRGTLRLVHRGAHSQRLGTYDVLAVHLDSVQTFLEHVDCLYILPIFECLRWGPARRRDPEHYDGLMRRSWGLLLRKSHCEGKYERVGLYHAPFLVGKPALQRGHPEQLVNMI